MIYKNGMRYDNNYERAVSFYLGTFGEMPIEKDRKEAYATLKKMYEIIASDIESIGLKSKADVIFVPWEKQKGREKDVQVTRSAIKKIEDIMKEFYMKLQTGQVVSAGIYIPEEVELPKLTLSKVLVAVEVNVDKTNRILEMSESCAQGFKSLSQQEFSMFARGIWDIEKDTWLEKDYDELLDAQGVLLWLCKELHNRGYQRGHRIDANRIALDYVKEYGEKEHPVKQSWGDKYHAGIEVTFEDIVVEPCYIWLRMPYFEQVLQREDELSEKVRQFIAQNTKTCDGCRYCVQTDKTGKRPLAAIRFENAMKCPRFPSFSMNWRKLSKSLAEDMLKVLDEVDGLLSNE